MPVPVKFLDWLDSFVYCPFCGEKLAKIDAKEGGYRVQRLLCLACGRFDTSNRTGLSWLEK